MKKRIIASVISACLLSVGTTAYADNTSDVLAQLQAIGQHGDSGQEANLSSLAPSGTPADLGETIPAEADIQAEWGDDPQSVLADWKAAAETDGSALSAYKYGLVLKETGDLSGAAAALEQAVAAAPAQMQLYQSLEEVYAAKGSQQITVFVDGQKIAFQNADPVNQMGVTLLPIRNVIEKLGANVSWDNATRTVTVRLLDKQVVIPQDSAVATVNGLSRTLEVPAQNINGRVLVPLRFVVESFGAKVGYIPGTADSYLISIASH